MEQRIRELTKKHLEKVKKLRRELHKYPEAGFKEFKTAEIIKRELDKLGIEYQSEIATTGILGIIKGRYEGKTVLLRADMDGLPIQEKVDIDYKSLHDGYMHACGHDGHTASLIGTAMILNELKDHIKGNIKLLFQPAEEGPGGAQPMIEEGVLENPKVDAAFSWHVWGALKAGDVQMMPGAMMSHPTSFDIVINGVGGHGSTPHLTIDPIVIAAQLVTNFQNIISRGTAPLTSAVLSCCRIKAGEANNVIPDKAELGGTIRSFDEKVTDEILDKMKKILDGVTSAYGATYDFKITRMYPVLINDIEMYEISKKAMKKVIGEHRISELPEPVMGSEDFSYFCNKVPSNYFVIGIKDDNEPIESCFHHHPKFKWDEKHLEVGMQGLAQIALDYLNK